MYKCVCVKKYVGGKIGQRVCVSVIFVLKKEKKERPRKVVAKYNVKVCKKKVKQLTSVRT
jgi:hypothetical protein